MDLPPPPLRYKRHRCADVHHSPIFFPPPSPPQPPRPMSPPFPSRDRPALPRSQRFERSPGYAVDSQRRRCLDRNLLAPRQPPPPPPPIYREELFPVQRLCYSSSEPNPNFRGDRFNRDLLNCWADRGPNDRFIHVGNGEGYCDGYFRGSEFYEELDERVGNRLLTRGCGPNHERHSYQCRLDTDVNDRACELYDRRDNCEIRWGGGIINEGFKSYSEQNDFERRLINDINNRRLGPGVKHGRVQDLYMNREDVGKRLDYNYNNRVWEHGNGRLGYGMDDPVHDLHMKKDERNRMPDCNRNGYINVFFDKMNDGSMRMGNYRRGHELYKDVHDDVRGLSGADFGHDGYGRRLVSQERYSKRLKSCVGDGVSLQLANERDPPFRRGLWSGYRKRENTRFNKKDTALHRVQLGKPSSRSQARMGKQVPPKLACTSRAEGNLTSSDPVVNSDINSATEENNVLSDKNNYIPGSPLTQSKEGIRFNDVSTFASNSESLTTLYNNDAGEDVRGYELLEDVNLEGSGDDTSGKKWEISVSEKTEEAQHVDETVLECDGIESIIVEIGTNNESRDPHVNPGAEILNCDMSSAFTGGTTDSDSALLSEEPAEVPTFDKGCESVRLSVPREIAQAPEIQDNKCCLEIQMDPSISKPSAEVHQKSDIGVISDAGYENLNAKGIESTQESRPVVGVKTNESEGLRSTAIMNCSSITFGVTSSNVLSDDHKGITDSFLDAISDTVPPLPLQCSAGVKRKMEAEATQVYGSDTDGVTDMIGTTSAAVITDLTDISTELEVDFPVEDGIFKENSAVNEVSHGVKDSDIDFDTDFLSSGRKKKRKVLISESIPSLSFEDDFVAEGNSSKFDNLSECDTIESESTCELDTTYVTDNVSEGNVAQVDTMADGSKHHEHDDWAFTGNTLSLSGDANDVSTSNSVDGLDSDHCPSSPEDLLSHTDFSFSPIRTASEFQTKGQIKRRTDKVLDRNTYVSHAKKPPTLFPQNTTGISIYGKTKFSPNLKAAGGNFTFKKNQLISSVPSVFPGHHPPYNSSRKFQPSPVTKSRTWHRSENSSAAVAGVKQQPFIIPQNKKTKVVGASGSAAAVTGGKQQPSIIPQSQKTKVVGPIGSSAAVTGVKQQPSIIPQSQKTKVIGAIGSLYIRKGNSLVRNPSQSVLPPPKVHNLAPRSTPSAETVRKNQSSDSEVRKYGSVPQLGSEKRISSDSSKEAPNRRAYNLGESVQGSIIHSSGGPALDSSQETAKAPIVADCQASSLKRVIYVRKKSNQLIAASDTEDSSVQQVNSTLGPLSDGYYKKRKNQLVRASVQNPSKKQNVSLNVDTARHGPPSVSIRSSIKRRSSFKINRQSKFSLVWKLHDTKFSETPNNLVGPKMALPHLIPWKRATYRKSFIDALLSKQNKTLSAVSSHKILLSRKRGAIYTRSRHGYSLRMSKVLSIGGSSLKWSKSLEKNSKKVKEDAARSVAAVAKTRKEENTAPPILLKGRNVSRKFLPSVKHRPGERIFPVGSERYRMDSSGRTLLRIIGAEEPSSLLRKTAKDVKNSYIPSGRLIGSKEYVRSGNGNQLVRDPKRRTRTLASERVRWSLRTARLRLVRKKTYCQFFTRFGKCNKEDGKCPYIHDVSKIAVCTKFLAGTCSNADCKLTHKVIPERMQDCSYFLRGSCSNENCPYRHVIVDPDAAVCESFLRGYCADGNECRKKHTYVCPAFEETGICPQSSTCKLHHPKKKPLGEEKKVVRGRYFDGGLTPFRAAEDLSLKGKDNLLLDHGKYPDFISLGTGDEELERTSSSRREDARDDDVGHRLGSPLAFDCTY